MNDDDPVGQAIHSAITALDDLIVLVNQSATREHVMAEKVALGQIKVRSDLLLSFILATQQSTGLRLIKNA